MPPVFTQQRFVVYITMRWASGGYLFFCVLSTVLRKSVAFLMQGNALAL
ncbi:MAG: hypothetical protein V7K48_21035 [Nostoc sp.]